MAGQKKTKEAIRSEMSELSFLPECLLPTLKDNYSHAVSGIQASSSPIPYPGYRLNADVLITKDNSRVKLQSLVEKQLGCKLPGPRSMLVRSNHGDILLESERLGYASFTPVSNFLSCPCRSRSQWERNHFSRMGGSKYFASTVSDLYQGSRVTPTSGCWCWSR